MGTEKKTDVEKAGYKGQVKSVKVTAFKIEEKDGKQVLTQVRSKYDEKGNETETISYDANGKIEYKIKYIYKYGEKGNLISRTTSGPRKPRWAPDEQIWEFTYWD